MYLWDSKRTSDEALEKQKQETLAANEREAALRQEKEEEIATLRGEIDSSNTVIAGLVLRADESEAQAEASKEEAERLRKEVQPVIDANPALHAYVTALYATIDAQNKTIEALRFSLVEWEKKEVAYQRQIQAQVEISLSWKRQYESERALRIGFESAFHDSQHALRKEKQKKRWYALGAGVAGALLGGWIG